MKTTLIIGHICSFTLLFTSTFDLYAQNGNNNPNQGVTQWKTNGNIADSNNYFGTKNQVPIKFRSNDVERMRITPTGDIGIGTSDPQAKLDVNGDVILRDNLMLTGLNFSNGLNSNILLVDEYGNVSKAPTLSLAQVIYQPQLCPTGIITAPTWSNGPNKIYVRCPQVRVGIGTDEPTHSLHTTGQVLFNSTLQVDGMMSVGIAPSSFSRFKVKNHAMNAAIEVDQSGNSNEYSKILLFYYTNPTTEIIKVQNTQTNHTPFLLQASGQMTIHNGTQKIFQLDANGLLHARRIKVDADSWADYVFEKSYKLMPLTDVNAFILKNKHLPNIPSEAEVKENGVDLVEMNKLLLQKIEELTLYLIEQDKAFSELQKEIQELQHKISE